VSVPYVTGTYPYRGLNGDDLKTALGGTGSSGCGLQEVATDVNGSYQVYTPSGGTTGANFHVPNTLGMWIECTTAFVWTPS
jgi:hypothetical protein